MPTIYYLELSSSFVQREHTSVQIMFPEYRNFSQLQHLTSKAGVKVIFQIYFVFYSIKLKYFSYKIFFFSFRNIFLTSSVSEMLSVPFFLHCNYQNLSIYFCRTIEIYSIWMPFFFFITFLDILENE